VALQQLVLVLADGHFHEKQSLQVRVLNFAVRNVSNGV